MKRCMRDVLRGVRCSATNTLLLPSTATTKVTASTAISALASSSSRTSPGGLRPSPSASASRLLLAPPADRGHHWLELSADTAAGPPEIRMLPMQRLLSLHGGQLSSHLRWRALLALGARWALLSLLRTFAGTASHRQLSCSRSRHRPLSLRCVSSTRKTLRCAPSLRKHWAPNSIYAGFVYPEGAPSRPSDWRLLRAYSLPSLLPTPGGFFLFFSPLYVGDLSSLHHCCRGGAGRLYGSSAEESGWWRFPTLLLQKLGELDVPCLFWACHYFLKPPLTPHLTSTDVVNAVP